MVIRFSLVNPGRAKQSVQDEWAATPPATADPKADGVTAWVSSMPERYAYLGPSEKHIYYAVIKLDAANLAWCSGRQARSLPRMPGRLSGLDHWDLGRSLLTSLATFPTTADAAALTAADTELWYYSKSTA